LRHYSNPPKKGAVLSKSEEDIPHVTIIRPCKGLEPYLYECLAATFQQDYPAHRLTVHFCVSSRDDPAYPTIEQVVKHHAHHDARIFVEEEEEDYDHPVRTRDGSLKPPLGPNPKIRNMSRAYREAKGDILWILDCNIWVSSGACARMVDKLCGYTAHGSTRPYKLVHHIPICVDVEFEKGRKNEAPRVGSTAPSLNDSSSSRLFHAFNRCGGRFEEIFLATSHAKMYAAINTVAVAPCINGKSNMFRRSHLNYLTSPPGAAELSSSDPASSELEAGAHSVGIDYFSHNICEDHLIGDLLWRSKIPTAPHLRNHGLVFGDLAIQPLAGMTVASYVARRVRWLRVRKFTVPVATLVEPGTESFLCSAYGAFGATTCRYTRDTFGSSWLALVLWWCLSVCVWAAVDWTVYSILHSGRAIDTAGREQIPSFARRFTTTTRRPFKEWILAWLGREALALPIWTWAIWGGVTVTWRERKFWVGMDMRVHEITSDGPATAAHQSKTSNGHVYGGNGSTPKARID